MSRPKRFSPRRSAPGAPVTPPSPARPRKVVVVRKKGNSGANNAGMIILALVIVGGVFVSVQAMNRGPKQRVMVVQKADKPAGDATAAPASDVPADSSGPGMTFIAPKPDAGDQGIASAQGSGKELTPFGQRNGSSGGPVDGGSASPAAEPGAPKKRTLPDLKNVTAEEMAAAQASIDLDKEGHLAVFGLDAQKTPSKQRDTELMAKAIKAGAWEAYSDLLTRSLSGNFGQAHLGEGRNRYDSLWGEPVFYQTFLRWQIFNRIKPADLDYKDRTKTFMSWLLVNNNAMEEVLLTLKPADNKAKVVSLLADYQAEDPDKFGKYFNTALACAVVFDQTVNIPAASQSERFPSTVDPMKRYRWYLEKDAKGKLLTNIDKMSARDLVWVVCAPIADTELDWAIEKMHLTRKGWGATYDKVEYLMERAVKGVNPYDEYSLAEILKKGGICGDRSYFCVNTARAHGIPAMTIGGETDLGGHAWAGVKIRDDEWTTTVGRIGGSANGQADNPQVGGQTSEQEIWLWNDRAQQSDKTTREVFRNLWLADYFEQVDKVQEAEQAIRLANVTGRAFSETWTRLHSLLTGKTQRAENPGAPEVVKDWVSFVAEMRNEFRENPRMAALATQSEKEHIFPYIPEEEARKTLARERRRIERNSGEQKDLIATSIKDEADLIKQKGGDKAFEDISNLYSRGLRDYGGSITGFKAMAEDYFGFVSDDQTTARKAAREIELAFDRVVKTGSKDWFRANTETSIYKMICGYYRKAGDEDRAKLLEKEYTRLLKQAERGAL